MKSDIFSGLSISPAQLEQLKNPPLMVDPFSRCLCGTLLRVQDYIRKQHSGLWRGKKLLAPGVNYTDLLCEGCRKEHQGSPRIVCIGCRKLMGFIKHGKQSTGFEFKRGHHYHLAKCPQCDPKVRATPVLEHERFCADNGIQTKTNLDLLQDIEQKILHARDAAAKMRDTIDSTNESKTT